MKRILLSLSFIIAFAGIALAQPASDTCMHAISLTPDGSCYTDDNTGVTTDMLIPPTTCVGNTFQAVWYTFTVPANGGSAVINVNAGFGDAAIGVYEFTGPPCDPLNVGSTWCANGNNPTLIIDGDLTPGTTYYIAVSFQNLGTGSFDLCVEAPVLVSNDECANAMPLANLDGNCNSGLTNDFSSTDALILGCTDPVPAYSVWYSFVAQGVSIQDLHVEGASGPLDVSIIDFNGGPTCNVTDPNTDVIICEQDADFNNIITLDNELVIGNTYYVQVSTEDIANFGTFDLCLNNPPPPFNDFCVDAPVIPPVDLSDPDNCITSLGGEILDNTYPSTDVGTANCWGMGDTYNVWFQFVAQGPDVEVEVIPDFGAAEQIAIIDFGVNPCDAPSGTVLDCENGQSINLDNTLIPGNTYFIMLGFDNNDFGTYCINVFNPVPPPNDMPCDALTIATDGSCNAGACPGPGDCFTTENATADPDQVFIPAQCAGQFENTVWFTFMVSDPNNVGFEVDLSEITAQNVSALLGYFDTDCNDVFRIVGIYCDGTFPGEFGPLDDAEQYYLLIGTSEDDQGTFQVCVDEIPPCFDNNFCNDPTGVSSANDLGIPMSLSLSDCVGSGGDAFICVEGCNQFADPEPGLTGCLGPNDPVVWYTFTTDAVANILNMSVTSSDFAAPTVQLFLDDGGGCNNLIGPIGLTANNNACLTGSGGEVIANSTSVGAAQTYYIAIGGVNTFGGDFELCISTLESSASCVTSSEVEVVSRSFGGPLEGPFFPGEQVNICLTVNNFQVSTGVQNCQWFQGLVPVFGNGWDTGASFDGNGQPMNATMNGNTLPAGNVENAGTWDWWTNVEYHHPHCFYNVGDFDGNGTLDMCNGLFDPDCMVPAPGWDTGGCCGPCWDTAPGNPLPPGWFTSGVSGSCGQDGWPAVDWGDGNTCNGPTGPWSFCFDLTVREYPDCQQDMSTMDLSVGFITFADGEVGSWNGGPSVCGQDEPTFVRLPMCCNDLVDGFEEKDPICTNGVFQHLLDDPSIADFWEWTVNAGSVVGATPGSGPNGTNIINNLTNPGPGSQIVTYNILGFQGGECPSAIIEVTIEVFPNIQVDLDPFTACSTPTNPYTITPNVEGGSGNYTYDWNTGDSGPSIEVSNPSVGQQFIVTVTDDVGCSGTAALVLDVYTGIDAEIEASSTGQCVQEGQIDLTAMGDGGIPGYSYQWTIPGGGSATGPNISTAESGLFTVTVTDAEGCTGTSTIALNFFDAPEVNVNPEEIFVCPNDPDGSLIFSVVLGGQQPFQFEWSTPGGFETTPNIFAEEVGTYTVTVTDLNGCTAETDFVVMPSELPDLELGEPVFECPDILPQGIDLVAEGDFEYYTWQGGPQGPTEDTYTVFEPGTYYLTVENSAGCTAEDEVTIEAFPAVTFDLPDTYTFCTGGFAEIDAGSGFVEYDWEHGPSEQEVLIFNPGLYFVTVTDVNGCTDFEEIIVEETGFLQPQIAGDTALCGTETTTLVAPDGYEIYEWNTASDDESIPVTDPGWYSVTVTDITGCTGVDSVQVILGDPQPAITGNTSICDGEAAILDVGTSFAEVLWSNSETTNSIQVTDAGSYIVTVTDEYGCTAETSIDVNVGTNPTPQIAGSLSFCTGSNTTLDAGNGYTTYEWTGNVTSQTLVVDVPGTYMLTVTSAEGCVGFDTVTVTEAAELTPNIVGDTSICNGVAVQLNAGSGFVSYVWTGGGSGQMLDVTTPGMVGLTVTDASGCTGTDLIEVISSAPDPDITGLAAVCTGESALLDAGAGWTEYVWGGSEITQTITVTTTGTYSVTVTDQYGCTGVEQFAFTANPNPTPTISGSSSFCTGGSTTLNLSAGFVEYLWSTGETTPSITVSEPGTIIATVTDANGCTGVDDIVISESTSLNPEISGPTAMCTGETIVLDAGGGFTDYEWGGGEIGSSITVDMGGVYTLTVADATGCTGETSFTVTESSEPFANVTAATTVCNTQEDGSVLDFSTLITGGDAGGSWVDNTGSGAAGSFPTLDFEGVAPGNYTFTYTTNSAIAPCEDQSYVVTVTVNDCACPSPEVAPASPLCNEGGNIDLVNLYIPGITEPGGTWAIVSTPAGANPAMLSGTVFDANGADAGTYTVEYTLANPPAGCPESAVVDIEVNPQPDAGLAAEPMMICAGEDESISLETLINDEDAGGSWVESSAVPSTGGAFNSATGTFTTTGQLPGSYVFEYVLSGVAPCVEAVTTIEVIIEELPSADAGTPEELTCDNKTAILGGPGTSTGADFTYLWTLTGGTMTNPTAQNPEVSKPGEYTLEVTNNTTGCVSIDVVTVTASTALPSGVDYTLQQPRCEGEAPLAGVISIAGVTGGTPPYEYSLNGGAASTTPNFSDLAPGEYTLLILDSEGCDYEETFTIDTPSVLDGTIEGELLIDTGSTTLTYTFFPGTPDSTIWLLDDVVVCTNCDSLTIEEPTSANSVEVTLIMYDDKGCEIILRTTVAVIRNRNIFIPNVFSPNNDGNNDFFTVFSGVPNTQIQTMRIFTRWGEVVYERQEFPAGIEDLGWDGRFAGKEMLPGVYVYQVELLYETDGETEILKGDITLVR